MSVEHLESVGFVVLTNLPKRTRDVILKPYPWQLGDASGTLALPAPLMHRPKRT